MSGNNAARQIAGRKRGCVANEIAFEHEEGTPDVVCTATTIRTATERKAITIPNPGKPEMIIMRDTVFCPLLLDADIVATVQADAFCHNMVRSHDAIADSIHRRVAKYSSTSRATACAAI